MRFANSLRSPRNPPRRSPTYSEYSARSPQAVENMERSTRIVEEGLTLGKRSRRRAATRFPNVVTEVYKFSQEIGRRHQRTVRCSSQIAKATSRLTEITQEISSAVEEQASGPRPLSAPWTRCANWCSNPLPVPRAICRREQMLKLSRNFSTAWTLCMTVPSAASASRRILRRPRRGSDVRPRQRTDTRNGRPRGRRPPMEKTSSRRFRIGNETYGVESLPCARLLRSRDYRGRAPP